MIVNTTFVKVITLLYANDWEIAVGTGTTPAHWDNLTLENEYDRKDATKLLGKTYLDDDTLIFSADFDWEEVKDITEFGLFHKTPAWMFLREVIPAVSVPVGEALPVIIHIPITRP